MIKLITFFFVLSFCAHSATVFSPLKYEYHSTFFNCSIDDLEVENDLDYFKGYQGCMRTGTEKLDFYKERMAWRLSATAFKSMQLKVAENFLNSIFQDYPMSVLKNDRQIRNKIGCYLSMYDNVPAELKVTKESAIKAIRLSALYQLNILPEEFFKSVFSSFSYQPVRASNEETLEILNEKLSKLTKKASGNEVEKIVSMYIHLKSKSFSPLAIERKDFLISQALRGDVYLDLFDVNQLADEDLFYPLVEKYIFNNRSLNGSVNNILKITDVLIKFFESSNVSLANKCSALAEITSIVKKNIYAREPFDDLKLTHFLQTKKLDCASEYQIEFSTYDASSNAFIDKWCHQKDLSTCVEGLSESGIPFKCERSSDCIITKISDCGYLFSNKDINESIPTLFKNWCSQKSKWLGFFLRRDDAPACFNSRCEPKGAK